jgi:hypothetical protein
VEEPTREEQAVSRRESKKYVYVVLAGLAGVLIGDAIVAEFVPGLGGTFIRSFGVAMLWTGFIVLGLCAAIALGAYGFGAGPEVFIRMPSSRPRSKKQREALLAVVILGGAGAVLLLFGFLLY